MQTRWSILIMPAIFVAILSVIDSNEGWIVLIGVYFVMGAILDVAFYPYVIRWQPPWLTFVIAVNEFALVYILAHWLKVPLTNVDAIVLYWVVWVLAIWTKVAILPLISLSWIENAGEFRITGWSVAPEYRPLPLTAFTPTPTADGGPPPLARAFSAVIEIPEELRHVPAPSGVFPAIKDR